MNIKEIADRAHDRAVKIGAYGDDAESSISLKIFEESNELREAIENRMYSGDLQRLEGKIDHDFKVLFESICKDSIEDEMADNILLLLAASRELNIDIEKHITYKQKYNSLRDDHK